MGLTEPVGAGIVALAAWEFERGIMNMILIVEGLAMCFILLIVCVIGIADGPAGLVTFYEEDVKNRVLEMGLTAREKIRKSAVMSGLAALAPMLLFIPYMVYGINGAVGFKQGFVQMLIIGLIYGLFDRLFIDWYWVGKTKAWNIPGTEDLKPYIPKKTLYRKWFGTLIVHPLFYALIAWVMTFVGK